MNNNFLERYDRHLRLEQVGEKGQLKLQNARVLIIGAGGLGCPCIAYLAAAGVGHLYLMDFDKVDISNLQRQILFNTNDVGKYKAACAAERVKLMNPDITVTPILKALDENNALQIIKEVDVVVDGSDNFYTRYLVSDACTILDKPLIYGAIYKFEGQISVFNFQNGPSYRCLFPDPPGEDATPNCSEVGVLGVLPGVIGTRQATEVLKIILEIGQPLSGILEVVNLLENTNLKLNIAKNDDAIQKIKKIGICPISKTNCNLPNEEDSISAEKFELFAAENYLLDVRQKGEQPRLNTPLLLEIPLDQLENRINELPSGATLGVICQSGVRSNKAIQILKANGFDRLLNIKGGVNSLTGLKSVL